MGHGKGSSACPILAFPYWRRLRARGCEELMKMQGGGGHIGADGYDFLCYLWICQYLHEKNGEVSENEDTDGGMLDADRCLLVAGIPRDVEADAARRTVSHLMGFAGNIERIVMNKSGASCVVVFLQASSVKLVIDKAIRREAAPYTDPPPGGLWGRLERSGMEHWVAEYRAKRRTLDEQQQHADGIIVQLERKRSERAAAQAEADKEAENDGWTVVVHKKDRKRKVRDADGTVSRGMKSSTAFAMAIVEKKKRDAQREKAEQGLDDFYSFQRKEKRKTELLELREKFLDDQRKLEDFKKRRKFKPS